MPTISPELAALLAEEQQNAHMAGMESFRGLEAPAAGGDLEDWLSNLHFSGDPQRAAELAQMNGIDPREWTQKMQQRNDATSKPNTTRNFLGTLGDAYSHNPLLMAATGLSALGVGAGTAGSGFGTGSGVASDSFASLIPTGADMGGLGVLAATPATTGVAGLAAGVPASLALPSTAGLASSGLASIGAAPIAAKAPGFFSHAGDMVKGGLKGAVYNADGSLNIPGAIKLGGAGLGALGVLGGMGGGQQESGPPSGWNQGNDALPAPTFSRHQTTPMADYANYGKSGGEHVFFADGPDDGTTVQIPDMDQAGHVRSPGAPIRPGLGRAGGGRTPSTGTGGRTDDIEALLSEGEYVMDAETVALLGNGSTEAGSQKLDELRSNIRRHKGAELAQGKISPDAKPAEAYMAKGGPAIRKATKLIPEIFDPRESELDAMRHMVDTFRMKHREQVGGHDPYNRTPSLMPKLKKADGGDVAGARARVTSIQDFHAKNPVKSKADPVKELVSFADRLEASLDSNSQPEFEASMGGIESLIPGSRIPLGKAMAKGGKVRPSIAEFIGKLIGHEPSMLDQIQQRRMTDLNTPQISEQDALAYLQALDPQSPVIGQIQEQQAVGADRDILTKIREARAAQVAAQRGIK